MNTSLEYQIAMNETNFMATTANPAQQSSATSAPHAASAFDPTGIVMTVGIFILIVYVLELISRKTNH